MCWGDSTEPVGPAAWQVLASRASLGQHVWPDPLLCCAEERVPALRWGLVMLPVLAQLSAFHSSTFLHLPHS